MPRLNALTTEQANPRAQTLLSGVEKKLGSVPKLMQTMANSPAVLEAYLGFTTALSKGSLSAKLREQIALAVGEANSCEYCLAAHATLGRIAGLTDGEIAESRRGAAADRKTEAALAFARKVVKERGWVSDEDVQALRTAGFDDGGIAEIVANVAVNIFTNYFNHVAETEIDFPKVAALGAEPACAC